MIVQILNPNVIQNFQLIFSDIERFLKNSAPMPDALERYISDTYVYLILIKSVSF
ncbi:MAG: hypothetical protein U1E78_12445 [Gammaproteobacteria bacterium]